MKALTSPEEIIAACEAGGIVVFFGDEPPFDAESDDNLVTCKVMGPAGVFWVIGAQDKREQVTEYARGFIEQVLGGAITSITAIAEPQHRN